VKGRAVILDVVEGRKAAALMRDGRLEDLMIDPPRGAPPAPGAIFRAIADRPMKGQGGMILRLPEGRAYLRRAKGVSPGDRLLVQVTGVAEVGKAAPVAMRLSFKGRYAIVTPDVPGLSVSRAIADGADRRRLLEIAGAATAGAPEGHGLIVRSAAQGAAADAIRADIAAMRDLALSVASARDGDAECLVAAPDAHEAALRDWAASGPGAAAAEMGGFAAHGVFEAVTDALRPLTPLPGGGTACLEPTRALIAIDVDTGGDTSPAAGLKANLALVHALPRLLRIKGLGGQIVLDLAPMPKRNRRAVEDAARKAFRDDGAAAIVAGWTPLGHLEIRKKRDRPPLAQVWPAAAR